MATRQINIRGVSDALYEWIEQERHARRMSQRAFLLKTIENAVARSSSETTAAAPAAFGAMTLVYWKSKKFWVGKLLEHPEIMTQGRTLAELERNIREAFLLMALDDVPKDYRVREVAIA